MTDVPAESAPGLLSLLLKPLTELPREYLAALLYPPVAVAAARFAACHLDGNADVDHHLDVHQQAIVKGFLEENVDRYAAEFTAYWSEADLATLDWFLLNEHGAMVTATQAGPELDLSYLSDDAAHDAGLFGRLHDYVVSYLALAKAGLGSD